MRIQPRDYQRYASHKVLNYIWQNMPGYPLVLMPTGTGKSVVIADFIEQILQYWPTCRILVVTHVKELVDQNHKKLLRLWPVAPAGVISAGLRKKQFGSQVMFAGIGSIARSPHQLGRVDVVIVDEAHMISNNDKTQYQKTFSYLKMQNPNLKVWGLTATGYRLGQGKLTDDGGLFTEVLVDMTSYESFNWFLDQAYLVPPIPRPVTTKLDVDGVHMRGGDFIETELETAVNKDHITMSALREAIEYGADRKHWLIFASGTAHAKAIQQMLEELGVPCGIVISELNEIRDSEIAKFKSGEYRALVNNNVLTTGFDFPGIDMIVMLRPTASTGLWVQMLGRGTRPVYPEWYTIEMLQGLDMRRQAIMESGKWNCLVLDFAGNTKRLGPINDPVVPRKKGKGGGEPPIKECDVCGTENHTRATHCVWCGAAFSFQVKIKQHASTDALVKTAPEAVVEVFKVDHTTYLLHRKADKPPMLKVSYQCGPKVFTDYVCVEHDGWAGRKARSWWGKRTGDRDLPVDPLTGLFSTQQALAQFARCKNPTHIAVNVTPKYPEITDYDFTGTAFGRQEDDGERPVVMNQVLSAVPAATPAAAPHVTPGPFSGPQTWDIHDDDIPF